MRQYPIAPANQRGPQATMLHSYHQAPFGPCDAFVGFINSCPKIADRSPRNPIRFVFMFQVCKKMAQNVWQHPTSSNIIQHHPTSSNIIQHHPTSSNRKWPSHWRSSLLLSCPFQGLGGHLRILRPARVEPVKLTRSTSGWAATTSPRTVFFYQRLVGKVVKGG